MVGVEIHLPNMASSQIIKPPAFKSPSRVPGNNCSARLGGSIITIEISRIVIGVGWVHTCLWIASATGPLLGSAF